MIELMIDDSLASVVMATGKTRGNFRLPRKIKIDQSPAARPIVYH
jgi:hypothetical protein